MMQKGRLCIVTFFLAIATSTSARAETLQILTLDQWVKEFEENSGKYDNGYQDRHRPHFGESRTSLRLYKVSKLIGDGSLYIACWGGNPTKNKQWSVYDMSCVALSDIDNGAAACQIHEGAAIEKLHQKGKVMRTARINFNGTGGDSLAYLDSFTIKPMKPIGNGNGLLSGREKFRIFTRSEPDGNPRKSVVKTDIIEIMPSEWYRGARACPRETLEQLFEIAKNAWIASKMQQFFPS